MSETSDNLNVHKDIQSLEDIAINTFFNTYLKNKTPTDAIKELFVSYLKENECIIDEYLSKSHLFHVFFRQEDSYVDYTAPSHDIHLVKSFATLYSAHQWIIANGKEVIEEQEDNYDTPIVLTIIEFENGFECCSDYYYDGMTKIHMIAGNRYPTYAFSEKGYDMLLNEHKLLCRGDWCSEIVIDWIYFIQDGIIIKRGCSKEHILELVDIYMAEYRDEIRQKALNKYEKFNEFK